MQRFLKHCRLLAAPDSRSSRFTAFAYDKIAASNGVAIDFVLIEEHCTQIRGVELTPTDVDVTEIGQERAGSVLCPVKHLAEFDFGDLASVLAGPPWGQTV